MMRIGEEAPSATPRRNGLINAGDQSATHRTVARDIHRDILAAPHRQRFEPDIPLRIGSRPTDIVEAA